MARKPVAAVQYARPDLVPGHLKKIALVLDNNLKVPYAAEEWDVVVYSPGDTLPSDRLTVGAVLYSLGDTIPNDLEIIAGFNGQGSAIPLLNDGFNGTVVDTNTWTLTDTEGKITVSGGQLVFAGGKAAPAWGDPALVSKAPYAWARKAGLTIECQVTPGAANTFLAAGWCDGLLSTGTIELHSLVFYSGVLYQSSNVAIQAVPLPYSAAQVLWFRIVLKATGAHYYVSTDNRVTWYLIWIDSSVTTTPLYAFIESYNAALTSSGVDVYQGTVRPPVVNVAVATITPSAGAEVLANGGVDTDLANWSLTPGTGTIVWDAGTLKITQGVSEHLYASQSIVTVVGGWYRFQASNTASSNANVRLSMGTVQNSQNLGTSGYGGSGLRSVAVRATGIAIWCTIDDAQIAAAVSNWDDATAKALTLSSLLGPPQTGCKEGLFDRTVYCASGYQAGFWMNWDGNSDGTEDYVEALVDRAAGTARLSKCVNGTITNNLISAAITYVAGAILRVVRVGTSYSLYYAGSQVGTTQTISDAGITNNTLCCTFGTDPTAANAADILTVHGGIGVA